jgi:urease accessory protein
MIMEPIMDRATVMITATATATDTATASESPAPATLLHLMWLASPALPVGGFSYSEGLESAVEAGRVDGESAAGDWLLAQLEIGQARAELPALAQACRAWQSHDAARVAQIDGWLRQTRETAELHAQSQQMGRSLLDWLRNGAHAGDARLATLAALQPAPLWPTAFALAAVLAEASAGDALLAYAWGWSENMAQAAMKAVPLGQAAAQRILTRLAAAIPPLVEQALALPDTERQAHTPMLAILSAQHETQYSRLFRS